MRGNKVDVPSVGPEAGINNAATRVLYAGVDAPRTPKGPPLKLGWPRMSPGHHFSNQAMRSSASRVT